jgi:TonB-dependent starch-binding outer membrane protein SusC
MDFKTFKFRRWRNLSKTLLIMKLTAILIFAISLQVCAGEGYAQNVSLEMKNVSLKKVFKEIQKQTGYYFLYSVELLEKAGKVDVTIQNASLQEAMNRCLQNTALVYAVVEKTIVIKQMQDKLETKPVLPKTPLPPVKITGVVTDENEKPLQSVTVLIKGTSIGTSTDENGSFEIELQENNAKVLVFSFVGMENQEINVSGKNNVRVKLLPKITLGSDLIVVGYGSQKKSDLTGAVSSIKADDLKLLPTSRVDQALQGRAAGVMVVNTDGAPGGNTSIRIRGMNSILGGNNALIVIDGLQGGNISTIDPNDIESMEVLKDASATAIYGSRGANGVILITTKGGKKGKPAINYNTSFGLQRLTKKLDVMNAYDYARIINLNVARNDVGNNPIPIFSDAKISEFKNNPGTDWQDEIYRVAPIQSHQLSLSGGIDNLSYYFSAGYLNQKGILLNSGFKRYSVRGNLNSQLSKWLKAGININAINTVGTVNPFGGEEGAQFSSSAIILAPQWPATQGVFDADGNYTKAPTNYGPITTWNPVASSLETSTKNYQVDNYVNAYLEFELLKGLKLKVNGTANVATGNNRTYFNAKTYEGIPNNGLAGRGFINQSRYEQYQNSNILTYDKNFGDHHITLTGVVEGLLETNTFTKIQAEQFAFDANGLNDLSGAKIVRVSSPFAYKRVLSSYLGRVNYIFADKYLLTASIRRDGSSVFGKNNKWGNFPSLAVGWKIIKESFMDNLHAVSELKLRGSWGKTGNQGISPYQSLASINSNASGLNYPYDGTDNTTQIGYAITGSENPNLKWETTTQTNIGLDFGLFKNRITATIDVYKKVTTNLLLFRTLPGYTGLYGITDNIGSTENKGIEVSLGGDPVTGPFKWHTNITATWMKNTVLDIGTDNEIQFTSGGGGYGTDRMAYLKKGAALGSWYGFEYLGLWKESEREQAANYGKLPGDIKYADLNKDGEINIADRKLIGNALPKVIFGWSNNFSYRGFNLSVFLQGVSGNNLFNTPRIRYENPGSGAGVALLNYWTPTNQSTDIPAFNKASDYQALIAAGKTNKYNIDDLYSGSTSRWVENGSYIRVKNITLGYVIPAKTISKLGIKNSRIYISGTNLLTFTKYKGSDPEVSSFNNNDASAGIDFGNYPTPRIFTLGLEISL